MACVIPKSFRLLWGCVLGFSLMLSGCGKKETPAVAKDVSPAVETVPVAATPSHAPAPQTAPPSAPLDAGNLSAEAAAERMTLELRKYVAYTHSIPKNFDEFVAHHPMKFPAPPAGKKYAIEGAQVVVR